MSEPTPLRSTKTTLGTMPSPANIRRSLFGNSHAISRPVSPAPTTTTVPDAGVGGASATRRRWFSSARAPS